jgi:ribonuclease BN (tRNA processing enzyme)
VTRPGAALLALLGVAVPALAEELPRPTECTAPGLHVQVLGSGGADLPDGRAGTAYLVWIDGKARAAVDFGTGAAMRFRQSGARAADLDVVLLTHLHADHTLDLPALVAMALREGRRRPLPLYGPTGNRFAPSTVTFVRSLLDGTRGVYRYLGAVLSPLAKDGFKLEPHDVRALPNRVGRREEGDKELLSAYGNERLEAVAAYVIHGGGPALAWRIETRGRSLVFSGDTNGEGGRLERLAHEADLFVAHHAASESAQGAERYEHMPPSVIGRVAAQARVKRLVLGHRTARTLGQEEAADAQIRTRYAGPLAFADDLNCFTVP